MLERNRLAVSLFILSESVFFLILIISYLYFYLLPSEGPNATILLNPWRTFAFSVCLFLSSATVRIAGRHFKFGRVNQTRLWLALTVLLGATFLVGQLRQYLDLFAHGVTIGASLFGTTFFTLTGAHGLHVIIGLFVLGTLLGVSLSKRVDRIKLAGFEAAVIYWHFVNAAWVVIFAEVYLWPVFRR